MWYIGKVNFSNFWAATTISIWVAKLGDAINQDKQRLEYQLPLDVNQSYALALDIGLRAGDKLFVQAGHNQVAVNLFGLEEANKQ